MLFVPITFMNAEKNKWMSDKWKTHIILGSEWPRAWYSKRCLLCIIVQKRSIQPHESISLMSRSIKRKWKDKLCIYQNAIKSIKDGRKVTNVIVCEHKKVYPIMKWKLYCWAQCCTCFRSYSMKAYFNVYQTLFYFICYIKMTLNIRFFDYCYEHYIILFPHNEVISIIKYRLYYHHHNQYKNHR